ncbi:hypothetical protein [Pedobacter sp.]|uniref:hypothetical protein n=1 Tax=Pedobacter sp. TaxID=1411316 RepID=UPI003BABF2CD
MVKFGLVWCVWLLMFCTSAKAAVGCRIGNTIYTTQYSGANATIVITLVTYGNFYPTPTLSANTSACPRATNITNVAGLINLCVLNGNILNSGTMVNYDRLDPPIACPLDEGFWLQGLLLALCFIGLLRIKGQLC